DAGGDNRFLIRAMRGLFDDFAVDGFHQIFGCQSVPALQLAEGVGTGKARLCPQSFEPCREIEFIPWPHANEVNVLLGHFGTKVVFCGAAARESTDSADQLFVRRSNGVLGSRTDANDHDHDVISPIGRLIASASLVYHLAIGRPKLPDVPPEAKLIRVMRADEFSVFGGAENQKPLWKGQKSLLLSAPIDGCCNNLPGTVAGG